MKLELRSGKSDKVCTIGELYIDGVFECYVLEDVVREIPGQPVEKWKVHGKTAIPSGTYKIALTMSPKYGRIMPLLVDVPGYAGVRIHSGNRAEDTEGCLLVGESRGADYISNSRNAYTRLFLKLEAAQRKKESITIEIKRAL